MASVSSNAISSHDTENNITSPRYFTHFKHLKRAECLHTFNQDLQKWRHEGGGGWGRQVPHTDFNRISSTSLVRLNLTRKFWGGGGGVWRVDISVSYFLRCNPMILKLKVTFSHNLRSIQVKRGKPGVA